MAEAAADLIVVAPCGFRLRGAVALAGELVASGRLPEGTPVWAVDADAAFVRPGPRLVDGVEALAAMHPPWHAPPPRPSGCPGHRRAVLSTVARAPSPSAVPCTSRQPLTHRQIRTYYPFVSDMLSDRTERASDMPQDEIDISGISFDDINLLDSKAFTDRVPARVVRLPAQTRPGVVAGGGERPRFLGRHDPRRGHHGQPRLRALLLVQAGHHASGTSARTTWPSSRCSCSTWTRRSTPATGAWSTRASPRGWCNQLHDRASTPPPTTSSTRSSRRAAPTSSPTSPPSSPSWSSPSCWACPTRTATGCSTGPTA